MSIYLDSAVLTEVESASKLDFVAGVTMNPTLVARAEQANDGRVRSFKDLLSVILSICPGQIFFQVMSDTAESMVAEALDLVQLSPKRMIVKIPCCPPGFSAVRQLRERGVKTLLTAVFTPTQAHIAAGLGADYIAPYVGRYLNFRNSAETTAPGCRETEGDFIRSLKEAMYSAPEPPRILAASIKSLEAVSACLVAGAEDVTLPLSLLDQLWRHPLTEQAIHTFAADAAGCRWSGGCGE